MKYIAYYRVSTREQGNSGLGLDAQRSSVENFISKSGGEVLSEYTDIESGANDNRPQLAKAIADCKKYDATLVIAKLDRLSRSAAFIFTLESSEVEFVCCDMPTANRLTVRLMAVLAQEERELISTRTKDALAERKRKGLKLGSPQNLTDDSRAKAYEANRNKAAKNPNNMRAKAMISQLIPGLTFTAAAEQLNKAGFVTSKGKQFDGTQVRRLYLVK